MRKKTSNETRVGWDHAKADEMGITESIRNTVSAEFRAELVDAAAKSIVHFPRRSSPWPNVPSSAYMSIVVVIRSGSGLYPADWAGKADPYVCVYTA